MFVFINWSLTIMPFYPLKNFFSFKTEDYIYIYNECSNNYIRAYLVKNIHFAFVLIILIKIHFIIL